MDELGLPVPITPKAMHRLVNKLQMQLMISLPPITHRWLVGNGGI